MRIVDEILNKNFNQFDALFQRISEHILDNKKLLIAVSGGPDSMFLSILILKYFKLNNLNLDNLFFVHCNHKTRLATDDEQKFVEEFFD
jgi:tRNA(Ile)-lysidine synthase TilS/MesJ